MPVDVILGLQWGDEGKGKIVDYLANQYKVVCRFQGGPNAGHTLYINGQKQVLHTIPSGVFRADVHNLIGNGVVIDPITFTKEVNQLRSHISDLEQRLLISQKAHLILPTHRWIDLASENAKGKNKIGSTLRGIGPTYMDKTGRNGLRVGDLLSKDFKQKYTGIKEKHYQFLRQFPEVEFDIKQQEVQWFEAVESLKQFPCVASEYWINSFLEKGESILAEGAQGTMLDVDFGTYPFVTSSNTTTAGVCTGLGIPAAQIRKVIGIAKAYCTRVGSGPFPSELENAVGERLRSSGSEFGATTGRPRRCGWLDLVQLHYSIMINGVTDLCITKIDVLNDFETFEICNSYLLKNGSVSQQLPYQLEEIEQCNTISLQGWMRNLNGINRFEDLPDQIKVFNKHVEDHCKTRISYLSVGPGRDQLIVN